MPGKPKVFIPDHQSLAFKRSLIRYLVSSSIDAFRVNLDSTVSADENYILKVVPKDFENYDVIAYMDVLAQGHKLSIRLCLDLKTLERLAKRMLGDEDISTSLLESIPMEMLNMIYGGAKTQLGNLEEYRLPPALPSLARKENFRTLKRGNVTDISVIPLVTPLGTMHLEVELRQFMENM